jgi:hypothetical protein
MSDAGSRDAGSGAGFGGSSSGAAGGDAGSGSGDAGARPMYDDIERLRGLAAWADALARPDFTVGRWIPSEEIRPGVRTMPWFDLGDEALRFLGDLGRFGWVRPFAWMDWLGTPRGRDLSGSPDIVATATAEELANLLTAIVRSERFGDGSIEGAHEKGLLEAAARRAGVLAADLVVEPDDGFVEDR